MLDVHDDLAAIEEAEREGTISLGELRKKLACRQSAAYEKWIALAAERVIGKLSAQIQVAVLDKRVAQYCVFRVKGEASAELALC